MSDSSPDPAKLYVGSEKPAVSPVWVFTCGYACNETIVIAHFHTKMDALQCIKRLEKSELYSHEICVISDPNLDIGEISSYDNHSNEEWTANYETYRLYKCQPVVFNLDTDNDKVFNNRSKLPKGHRFTGEYPKPPASLITPPMSPIQSDSDEFE